MRFLTYAFVNPSVTLSAAGARSQVSQERCPNTGHDLPVATLNTLNLDNAIYRRSITRVGTVHFIMRTCSYTGLVSPNEVSMLTSYNDSSVPQTSIKASADEIYLNW